MFELTLSFIVSRSKFFVFVFFNQCIIDSCVFWHMLISIRFFLNSIVLDQYSTSMNSIVMVYGAYTSV